MGLLGDSWDDPKSMATFRLAAGLLGTGSFGDALDRGLQGYQQTMDADQLAKMRAQQMQSAGIDQQVKQMQLAQMQQANQLELDKQAAAKRAITPATPAITGGTFPALAGMESAFPPGMGTSAPAQPAKPPGFDMEAFMQNFAQQHPLEAAQMRAELRKANQVTTKEGERVWDTSSATPKLMLDGGTKKPDLIQEFDYSQDHPGFVDFATGLKKAGATNVTTKVETKMGDSVAGQIGPMAKDSYEQTKGALQNFDAATRLENALKSGMVYSGPGATALKTANQVFVNAFGGDDTKVRNTQQAIKSLAQMAVQARKQLQGQGAVTDSEAAAVAKADAGDIDSLTPGELQDLVKLTKRASAMQARNHQTLIQNLMENDATRQTAPFYRLNGLDPLLSYDTTLPKVEKGGWSATRN